MKIFRIVLIPAICLFLVATASLALFPSLNAISAFAQQKQAPAKKRADQDKPEGQTAISISVDLVNLQALVTDKKGNIITGLRPENFTLYEDGVRQEISHFTPVDAAMTSVLLVEFSKQIEFVIEDVWNSIAYFADSLRAGDWVAIIGYDIRPTILTDFTQNREKISEALSRFSTPAFRESNLSDALIYTLDRVEEIEGKTAIILVSTGLDTFSRSTYDEALKKARSANASVYAISVGQSLRIIYNLDNIELMMADNRLRSFAEATGGDAYFPRFSTELPSIFKNISNSLRNQYSIGYVSTNPKKDGKFRKIRLEAKADINKDGNPIALKVQTRQGYNAVER